jgi:hypothetical protein
MHNRLSKKIVNEQYDVFNLGNRNEDPPTHPLFAYTKNRSQPTLPQVSNDLQNSISPFFSNLFQALIALQFLQ